MGGFGVPEVLLLVSLFGMVMVVVLVIAVLWWERGGGTRMPKEVVVCKECGTENRVDAVTCKDCHAHLAGIPAQLPRRLRYERGESQAGVILAGLGLIGVGVVGGWLVLTMSKADELAAGLSAVQVSQVYTQAGFWMLAVIAMLLAGILYVSSR